MLLCDKANIKDLSPIKHMPLKEIRCDFDRKPDGDVLRAVPTLETINGKAAPAFYKSQGLAPPP
ncbi:MAG TPA: hypothetical protein VMS17_03985 [Gemmataceae bacterium]|nr:hypothetical protein [Gemmataceae bacterium]